MVTTDALVFGFDELGGVRVLLVNRGQDPFKGLWAVPGGFVEMDEDLPLSAARELEEETGLTGISLQQLATFGKPGRDPRGRMVTIVFWGLCKLVDVLPQTRAGDDAAMAQWFALDKLGELEMAFDHREVVALGIERLKTTSEYKNLAKQ
jgi:8-oxo-dGTP diphosphatase